MLEQMLRAASSLVLLALPIVGGSPPPVLPGNLPHIGLVTDRLSADGRRRLIVHNIGRGPEIEDMLFAFPITGHYRYRGE